MPKIVNMHKCSVKKYKFLYFGQTQHNFARKQNRETVMFRNSGLIGYPAGRSLAGWPAPQNGRLPGAAHTRIPLVWWGCINSGFILPWCTGMVQLVQVNFYCIRSFPLFLSTISALSPGSGNLYEMNVFVQILLAGKFHPCCTRFNQEYKYKYIK